MLRSSVRRHGAPRNIVGTISGNASAVTNWCVDYALAELVNPQGLADPDYVLLNQGTGPVTSASLGTLPSERLPGAYLRHLPPLGSYRLTGGFRGCGTKRTKPFVLHPRYDLDNILLQRLRLHVIFVRL